MGGPGRAALRAGGRWLSRSSSGQRWPQQPPQQPGLWVLPELCDLWLPPPQQPQPLLRCRRRLIGKQQQPEDVEPQQPESPQQPPESPPQQPQQEEEAEAREGTGAGAGAGYAEGPWDAPLEKPLAEGTLCWEDIAGSSP